MHVCDVNDEQEKVAWDLAIASISSISWKLFATENYFICLGAQDPEPPKAPDLPDNLNYWKIYILLVLEFQVIKK